LTLFDTAEEVLYLLPNTSLSSALRSNPQNLINLLKFTTNHLFESLSPPSEKRDNKRKQNKTELHKEILNCIRVLTRLLPILFEPRRIRGGGGGQSGGTGTGTGTGGGELEEEIFWKKEKKRRRVVVVEQQLGKEEQGQFVLEDDEDNEEEDDDSQSNPLEPEHKEEEEEEFEELPCLAERLISTLISLLFVPGLTLQPLFDTTTSEDPIVTYSIWCVFFFLPSNGVFHLRTRRN